MSKKLTKKEALQEFNQYILPHVVHTYEQDGIKDHPARREAWNDYTDTLCKDGRITDWQYSFWTNPF